jgi:peptidoglycan/LPS O-acetylase OafA/YrhL
VRPAKRQAILVVIAVAVLVLALIVFSTDRSTGDHLLAAIGLLGGLAIVIVSLPEDKDK